MDALSDFYQHILMTLRRTFDYSGRATRKEYWLYWLFYALVVILADALEALIGMAGFDAREVLNGIALFALLVPGLAVAVRRLHDTDRAGWWMFLVFASIFGYIVLFVFFVQDGSNFTNRFGNDPKGRDVADIFS